MNLFSENTESSDAIKPMLCEVVVVKPKKPKCYNCKFAGKQFKVNNLTHLHCEDEKQYPREKWESGELTAWDSLQQFNWTCENHEFKTKNDESIK